MLLFIEEIRQQQTHAHRKQAQDSKLAVRNLLDGCHPRFHLIRASEIGEALHDHQQSYKAEKPSHPGYLVPTRDGCFLPISASIFTPVRAATCRPPHGQALGFMGIGRKSSSRVGIPAVLDKHHPDRNELSKGAGAVVPGCHPHSCKGRGCALTPWAPGIGAAASRNGLLMRPIQMPDHDRDGIGGCQGCTGCVLQLRLNSV